MTADEEFEFTNADFDGGELKGHPPPGFSGSNEKPMSSKPGVATPGNSPKGELPNQIQAFLKQNLRNILPALMALETQLERGFRLASPYINQGIKIYNEILTQLEPYGLNEIATCVTGFAMMFFGGFFVSTVAVWEAIVQGGLDNFKTQMRLLYTEYSSFREENKKDDEEDLDGDGIADVLQISNEQYTVRKMLVALRAINPNNISQALHTLYTIFIAVAATLRLQFARTISLGASIGDQFFQVYEKIVIPQLEQVVEQPYHKWLKPTGSYLCRFIGVSIAFRIYAILATFHTAVKGARTFTKGLTDLSIRNGYGHWTEGYLDEALSVILAVMGIYLQLFLWGEMPLIVKLIFFPAFLVESILNFFVEVTLLATSPTVPK